jgi:rare lipoprotein A
MSLLHKISASIIASALLFAGCSVRMPDIFEEQDSGPDRHVDLSRIPDATPRVEPKSRYGNPPAYTVLGKRYQVMSSADDFTERGVASWYGNKFHGRRTSSGEPYDMFGMTAAHKHLPLPTYVEVTNLENDRKVIVKVNDRGPFHQNRVIDLSYAAAAKLGITAKGTGLVEIRAIDPRKPQQQAKTVIASGNSSHAKPGLFIQAGAFRNRDYALRMQSRLQQSLDNPIRITEFKSPVDVLYRVQVGPLGRVDVADTISLKLENMGITNIKTVIE